MRDECHSAARIRVLGRIRREPLENAYSVSTAALLGVEVGEVEPRARSAGLFRDAQKVPRCFVRSSRTKIKAGDGSVGTHIMRREGDGTFERRFGGLEPA